jgi:hypothetical protein
VKGHRPVYSFTKVVKGKKIDVMTCPCGVVGHRAAGTDDIPVRDPIRFKRDTFATCESKRESDERKRKFFSTE